MVTTVEKNFAALLRTLREERGLTQYKLAQKAGLTPSAISRLEAGSRSPSRKTLVRLAQALELGPEERKVLFARAGFWYEPPSLPEEVGRW